MTFATAGKSQVSAVVYDIELHTPVRGANIRIRPSGQTTTDVFGRFTVNGSFTDILIYYTGYEGLRLDSAEVKDTIWLLPNGPRIDEVIVIGHRPRMGFMKQQRPRNDVKESNGNNGLANFDLFNSLNFKKRKKDKRRKKIKKMLDDY